MFIDREKELEALEEEYKKERASFIVIYGRRRVGKTALIEEFIKNKKYLYYLAADEKEQLQIKELKEEIARFLGDQTLFELKIEDWKVLFSYLEKVWPKDEKIIFVIDEFSYLIKHNESITSYLQRFWDSFLSKTKTKLILCGSIVSLMLKNVLEKGSPLYGRRTLDLFIEKFSIKEVKEFLNTSEENAVKFYAVLDGIPKYLQLVEEKDFEKFLKKILDKRSFFYREGYYLMSEELKDISTFLNILRAIAEGNTNISEISNFTGIESKKIYPYLEILENLGFIKKQTPIFGERNSIYLIEDNFLDFWFRFVQKYRSYIEIDSTNKIIKNVFEEINSFIGKKFEKVCIDFVKKNFDFDVVGKQWGRIPKEKEEYEIDIVAIKKKEKRILLVECKWKEKVNAKELCKELEEKSNYIEWNKRERKEEFIIFAKSFKEKIKEFNGRKVYCFELKDLFV